MNEHEASEQPDAPGGIGPETIGACLRAAREAAGLTLADIADRTKVRPGILTEIEADDHENLPALTYTLGFVKAYARTVGLDPDETAERYRQESHKGDPVPSARDLQPLEEQRLPTRRLGWLSGVLLALALAGFWAWGAGWLTPPNPPRPKTSVPVPAATDTPGALAADEPAASAADSSAVLAAPSANALVTLSAKEEVWVKIADEQGNFFMGALQPGQVLTLPAGRNWRLRTGRAGALEVKVGTTLLPALGGPVEQLRDRSLAPADLMAAAAPPTGAQTGALAGAQAGAPAR